MKNICVIGTGYVGVITALGMVDFGYHVHAVDISKQKITDLQHGLPPFFEPELSQSLQKHLHSSVLKFSTNITHAVRNAELIFLTIGTPFPNDHYPIPQEFLPALDIIAQNLDSYKTIVVKSTVPPGSAQEIHRYLKTRSPQSDFDIVANPEFLREGIALHDFFHPHKIVIGHTSSRAGVIMEEVYLPLKKRNIPFIWTDWETAELIKYACNTFLATKISFINQLNNLASELGGDISTITSAMGMDSRISSQFLQPGPGYGGSCFPKDTRMLVYSAAQHGIDMSVLKEVDAANERQKLRPFSLLRKTMSPLQKKIIAVLGLTFKAQTDDIRESPSLVLIQHLLQAGAQVQAYDPKGMKNFSLRYPQVQYADSAYAALQDADAAVIMTEWDEFRRLEPHTMKTVMRNPFLIDTRNMLNKIQLQNAGISCHS